MSFDAHGQKCLCCNTIGQGLVTYHHEYKQKTYPEYKHEKWNLIPLCRKHHDMTHDRGAVYMSEKFIEYRETLIRKGWELVEFPKKKWIHPLFTS